jgi:hypothetical protein
MPQISDKKKLYLSPFPLIASKRGRSPTQARIPKSKLGNERTRRRDESKAKEKSFV